MTRTFLFLAALLALPAQALAQSEDKPECEHAKEASKDQKSSHHAWAGPKKQELVFQMIAKHGDELDINEKTQKKIRRVVEDHQEEMEEIHVQLKESHEAMKVLLEDPDAELEEILEQADDISDLKGDIYKQQLITMIELRKHLSPEQIEEIHLRVKRSYKKKHRSHGYHGKNHDDGDKPSHRDGPPPQEHH